MTTHDKKNKLHASVFSCTLFLSFFVAAPSLAASHGGSHNGSTTIDGDRIQLGQLDPTRPRDLLAIDLAPAPQPGHAITVSRSAVRSALKRAGEDPSFADAFPIQQKVFRSSRVLHKTDLHRQLIDLLYTRLPTGIKVTKINGLEDITLPMGDHQLEIRMGKLRRSTQASLTISVEDRTRETLSVTLFLEGQAMAPMLRRNLPKKAVIRDQDIAMVKMPLEKLPTHAALRKDQLVGHALVQAHRAGRALQKSQVKRPPVVSRGREVTLIAVGSGIRVSQPATCQEDGALGEWIRVSPLSGSRSLQARVISGSSVQIEIGSTH